MKTKILLVIHLMISVLAFSQVSSVDLIKEYTFTNGSLSNTINPGIYDLITTTLPATYTKTLDPLSQTDAALSLKGNELSAGQHPTTAIIDADFSVSFWIKTTNNNATESSIFNQVGKIAGSSFAFAGIRAYLQNGALSFGGHYRLGTGTYYSETTVMSSTINDGDWHHIVITGYLNKRLHATTGLSIIKYDYSIYIDNVLDASGSTTDGFDYGADVYLFEGTPDLTIGSSDFQGDLDNFRVYTRSLDVNDIDNLYKELKQTYTLATTATNGTITTDIAPTNGTYNDGAVVALTATPDAGYQFDGWSGDATGTDNPLSITMDADKNITAMFSVDATAGVVDNEFNSAIKIYPNPVKNTLQISLAKGETLKNVQVFNLLGKKVLETKNTTLNLGDFNTGIYVLKIENSNGKVAVRKIVKE